MPRIMCQEIYPTEAKPTTTHSLVLVIFMSKCLYFVLTTILLHTHASIVLCRTLAVIMLLLLISVHSLSTNDQFNKAFILYVCMYFQGEGSHT